MSEIQGLQWDDVPNLMALVKQFAIKMVAPHVVPEGEGRVSLSRLTARFTTFRRTHRSQRYVRPRF